MAVLGFTTVVLFFPLNRFKGILKIAVFGYSLARNLLFRVVCSYSLSETASVPP